MAEKKKSTAKKKVVKKKTTKKPQEKKSIMTPKKALFVLEYLNDIKLNATKAAERAGYSKKTARQAGARLLSEVVIKEAIQAQMDKRAKKIEVSAEYVLSSLLNVANRCQQAEPVLMKVGNKMVETGEYKFDSAGANKALQLLGQHLVLFTEKKEVSGPDGGPIETKQTVDGMDADEIRKFLKQSEAEK